MSQPISNRPYSGLGASGFLKWIGWGLGSKRFKTSVTIPKTETDIGSLSPIGGVGLLGPSQWVEFPRREVPHVGSLREYSRNRYE